MSFCPLNRVSEIKWKKSIKKLGFFSDQATNFRQKDSLALRGLRNIQGYALIQSDLFLVEIVCFNSYDEKTVSYTISRFFIGKQFLYLLNKIHFFYQTLQHALFLHSRKK